MPPNPLVFEPKWSYRGRLSSILSGTGVRVDFARQLWFWWWPLQYQIIPPSFGYVWLDRFYCVIPDFLGKLVSNDVFPVFCPVTTRTLVVFPEFLHHHVVPCGKTVAYLFGDLSAPVESRLFGSHFNSVPIYIDCLLCREVLFADPVLDQRPALAS